MEQHTLTTRDRDVLAYVQRHFAPGQVFGNLEVFPGRTPQDNHNRQALTRLAAQGFLEQPHPLRHQYRLPDDACVRAQEGRGLCLDSWW